MENITFSLATLHQHGSAFYDFLGLRKRFFVDTLHWDIPHDDTVEMDQYDNPLAHYSLVLRDGEVVGGHGRCPQRRCGGGIPTCFAMRLRAS